MYILPILGKRKVAEVTDAERLAPITSHLSSGPRKERPRRASKPVRWAVGYAPERLMTSMLSARKPKSFSSASDRPASSRMLLIPWTARWFAA
jgi:hypothetical protein